MRKLLLFLLLISSCASNKDILLIQDADNLKNFNLKFEEIKIKSDDILRIKISSSSPELAAVFSYGEIERSLNTLESYQINGYLVDSQGFVKIPRLKSVKVKGLTLVEASALIQNLLKQQADLTNATVDVKILNAYFTVLGEVNRPGRYNFLKNNLDIFQAIGIAGDLTINGKRNDIKIIRKNDNILKVNSVDITSTKLLTSKQFQIFPGDIIIVNPNNARVKNAGIIGNTGNLLSVLSFILTSIVLITSN